MPGSKFVKFLMSDLNFKLIHLLLIMKITRESPNFKTFESSGENFPNASFHFPNHKAVFLQILDHSSVS